MSPNDRHQIVVKTSAFHGYEGEVTLIFGGPAHPFGLLGAGGGEPAPLGAGALFAPPHAFAGALSPIIGAGFELKYWASYVPTPFEAEQLMLSSLGGWLRSRGAWNPTGRRNRDAGRGDDVNRRARPIPPRRASAAEAVRRVRGADRADRD